MTGTLAALALYLVVVVGVGIAAARRASRNLGEFYLGGRRMNEFVVALSEPAPEDDWKGPTGFVHLTVEKAMEGFGFDNEYYLCGPPLMVDAVCDMLAKHGVPEEDVAFDKF